MPLAQAMFEESWLSGSIGLVEVFVLELLSLVLVFFLQAFLGVTIGLVVLRLVLRSVRSISPLRSFSMAAGLFGIKRLASSERSIQRATPTTISEIRFLALMT